MSASRHPVHLYLVGMMGAGKSTAGRALAERFGVPFVDIDADVVSTSGSSIPELFKKGEDHFRTLEAISIAEAGSGHAPAVIAVGGGAVLRDVNRRLMQETGIVVWLRASTETLRGRVGEGYGRPVLARAADPGQLVEALVEERAPYYSDVADLVVDVDGLDVAGVVDAVVRDLDGLGPAGMALERGTRGSGGTGGSAGTGDIDARREGP